MNKKEGYTTTNWRGDTVYRTRYTWEPAADTIFTWIFWACIIGGLFSGF